MFIAYWEEDIKGISEERIDHNLSFSEFSKTQRDKLEKKNWPNFFKL